MSKSHLERKIKSNGTNNFVSFNHIEYIVLDPNLRIDDKAFFLFGDYTHNGTTYHYALNADTIQKKYRFGKCPSPNNSGTQTDDKPPFIPISSDQNTEYYFVIRCDDNANQASELFIIENNTRKYGPAGSQYSIDVWDFFEWDSTKVNNNNEITQIVQRSIIKMAWKNA